MIVWKLAIRPIVASSARTFATVPAPNVTLNPSSNGQFEAPSAIAPCTVVLASPTPAFRKQISVADNISVAMPFLGSADSSAASGSCSIARNSQTANGSVASTPFQPNGNHDPPHSGSSTAAPVTG